MPPSTEILRHIVNVSQNFQRKLEAIKYQPEPGPSSTPPGPLSPPNINFPPIPIITPRLLGMGVPEGLAQRLSEVFIRHAIELQRCTTDCIDRSWKELSDRNPGPDIGRLQQKHADIQIKTYSEVLRKWTYNALQRIQKARSCIEPSYDEPTVQISPHRHPFNHHYIPLLEHFFSENSFPTHADKAFLAKKTGMTYRQIHVWFQNRRNRSKKDGKNLKRKSMHETATLSFETLVQRMGEHIIPESQRENRASPDVIESLDESNDCDLSTSPAPYSTRIFHDVLDIPAPKHAFPSSYPPSCEYNPFPTKDGVHKFSPLQWARISACQSSYFPSDMDFPALIEMFARLNIRGSECHRRAKRQKYSKDNFLTTASAISDPTMPSTFTATKVQPAPLPAFIPRGTVIPLVSISPLPVVSAPASRLHVFATPSPQSRFATLIPPDTQITTKRNIGRKLAPLPKRIPKSTSIAHRGITPAMSEASCIPSLSLTSPSRTSSCGSSESRLFSESSSLSPSPHVRTPASSSTSLPQLVAPTLVMPGFSPSQQPSSMSNLFADSPIGSPSQAEGLQLDMNFFGDPHIAKASDFFGIPPSTNLVHAQS